ncbi:MAG: hypothetical protein IPJ65_39080 [Archangiaceae bacterium]|nr:hypothetical protein [Archangiaceae bacterium]
MTELTGILKTGQRFVSDGGLLDRAKCRALMAKLERELGDALVPMERGIPPQSIWGAHRELRRAAAEDRALLHRAQDREDRAWRCCGRTRSAASPRW